jgi:hypothetical protein
MYLPLFDGKNKSLPYQGEAASEDNPKSPKYWKLMNKQKR